MLLDLLLGTRQLYGGHVAKCVSDIMNRSVFAVRPDDDSELVLREIVALGITGVPVVDDTGKPLGMASFRDLLAVKTPGRVFERMTRPAVSVPESATIDDAARVLAEHGIHRVVVTGADGKVTGMVSSLDLIRGLVGMPAPQPHPATGPH
jgi:CBS domain-containing protein